MRTLENYSLKLVSDFTIDIIAQERNISKALARKLYINALSYNVVTAAINEQIDYLMEDVEE